VAHSDQCYCSNLGFSSVNTVGARNQVAAMSSKLFMKLCVPYCTVTEFSLQVEMMGFASDELCLHQRLMPCDFIM